MIYIYGLFCPIALTVRYVGKSNNPKRRLAHHMTTSPHNSHHTGRWLASLKRQGLQPTILILAEIEDGGDWESIERNYIATGPYFGWRLTNTTPGGEGGGHVNIEDRESWIAKVKESLQSEEVRNKISVGVKKAYSNPNMKSRAAERMRRRWANIEYREHMVSAAKQTMSRPEIRESIRESSKSRMIVPGAKEAVSAKLSGYYATDEGKLNKQRTSNDPAKVKASRDGQIANWQDPAYRKRMMEIKTSPEVIEKQKQKALNQWADPIIREKMIQSMRSSHARRKAEKQEST